MLTIQFPGMFGIQMVSLSITLDHFIERSVFTTMDPNTVCSKSGLSEIQRPRAFGFQMVWVLTTHRLAYLC